MTVPVGVSSPAGQRARLRQELLGAVLPLTSAELSARTGIPRPVVSARIRELKSTGRIVKAGYDGAKNTLWVAVAPVRG